MSYLASFRSGWESENLARYILSRFSFIASPATISDDIGSDFYCTLFRRKIEAKREYLIPVNSFAIQIKSDASQFDVTNKIGYFYELELPFLVGVIDKKDLKLSIFSGEILPEFLSIKTPKGLMIELCNRSNYGDGFRKRQNSNSEDYILSFPLVIEIHANDDKDKIDQSINELLALCKHIHKNISSKTSEEYIFQQYGNSVVRIVAGPGSAQTFRENFLKRLAEVFYNMAWIYEKAPEHFSIDEFRLFEKLYFDIRQIGYGIPNYVSKGYDLVKCQLSASS